MAALRPCLIGATILFLSGAVVILVLTIVHPVPQQQQSCNERASLLSELLFGGDEELEQNCVEAQLQDASRTIIQIYSTHGNIFIRGGKIVHNENDCHELSSQKTKKCSIRFVSSKHGNSTESESFVAWDAWRLNDDYLDWLGPEESQGTFEGVYALGTPLLQFKNNLWVLDILMDCKEVNEGWFEFRALTWNGTDSIVMEDDISQGVCTNGEVAPFQSVHHIAKCGSINEYTWSKNDCRISNIVTDKLAI